MLIRYMANGWPQLLVDHKSTAGPVVTQVRGSLVVSSLQTLRELDLYERYVAALPNAWREPVLFALASSWLPVDLVLAHYAACDSLRLTGAEMDAIGTHVAERVMGSFLVTLLRGSRVRSTISSSVMALQNYHRFWDRVMQGGGCRITLTGPKDAIIESRGVPMFRYEYFRTAYPALMRAAGMVFAKSCYTRVLRTTDTSMDIALSWV